MMTEMDVNTNINSRFTARSISASVEHPCTFSSFSFSANILKSSQILLTTEKTRQASRRRRHVRVSSPSFA